MGHEQRADEYNLMIMKDIPQVLNYVRKTKITTSCPLNHMPYIGSAKKETNNKI